MDMICTARQNAQMAGREIEFKTIGLADVDTAFKPDFDAIVESTDLIVVARKVG